MCGLLPPRTATTSNPSIFTVTECLQYDRRDVVGITAAHRDQYLASVWSNFAVPFAPTPEIPSQHCETRTEKQTGMSLAACVHGLAGVHILVKHKVSEVVLALAQVVHEQQLQSGILQVALILGIEPIAIHDYPGRVTMHVPVLKLPGRPRCCWEKPAIGRFPFLPNADVRRLRASIPPWQTRHFRRHPATPVPMPGSASRGR